jgi:hypothetical protein
MYPWRVKGSLLSIWSLPTQFPDTFSDISIIVTF